MAPVSHRFDGNRVTEQVPAQRRHRHLVESLTRTTLTTARQALSSPLATAPPVAARLLQRRRLSKLHICVGSQGGTRLFICVQASNAPLSKAAGRRGKC